MIYFTDFYQKKFSVAIQSSLYHRNFLYFTTTQRNFKKKLSITHGPQNSCIQFPFTDESLPSRSEVFLENGYASDGEKRKKSKLESENNVTMNQQQLMELENQLVMKIMKHFKDNFNYSPAEKERSEDIFYSPIGERKF